MVRVLIDTLLVSYTTICLAATSITYPSNSDPLGDHVRQVGKATSIQSLFATTVSNLLHNKPPCIYHKVGLKCKI